VRSVRLQGERRRVLPQEHRQLRSGAQVWGRVWPSWLNRVRPGWVGEALRRRRRCYRPRLGLGCSRCCLRLQHAEGRRKPEARSEGRGDVESHPVREGGPKPNQKPWTLTMGISDLRVPRARSPQSAGRVQAAACLAQPQPAACVLTLTQPQPQPARRCGVWCRHMVCWWSWPLVSVVVVERNQPTEQRASAERASQPQSES
jgi:hypothetical protein